MSTRSWLISSPAPVLLSDGHDAMTVQNQSSSATVWVGSDPGIDTYPLGPARSIAWDAGKPLYASTALGVSATVTISDDTGLLYAPVVIVQ